MSLALTSCFAANEASAQDTTSILFLGNSFTAANNTPELVRAFADSAKLPVHIDAHVPGGIFVYRVEHGEAAHAANPFVFEKIRSRKWDFIVVQDNQGYFMSPTVGAFAESGRVIEGHAKLRDSLLAYNPCGKIVLFSGFSDPWPEAGLFTPQASNAKIFEHYKFLNSQIDQVIAPIGKAWNFVLDEMSGVPLYAGDGFHPAYFGSYITAAVIFSTTFKENPELNTFNGDVPPDLALEFRRRAFRAVTEFAEEAAINTITPAITLTGSVLSVSTEEYVSCKWWANDTLLSTSATSIDAKPYTCYKAVATDAEGCEWTSMEFCTEDVATSISTLYKSEDITIMPNPVVSEFTIKIASKNFKSTKAIITDVSGKVLQELIIDTPEANINISNYAAGMYFLNIEGGSAYKLIKQ